MTNSIVQVDVTVQQPPAPSRLQRTGVAISQGGTNTTPGTRSLITELADLTPLLVAPLALTSLTYSANVITGTTTAPHGWGSGDVIPVVISGAVASGYNGSYNATVTGTSTFTVPHTGSPGTSPAATPGFVVLADRAELLAMFTTFFAQGTSVAAYVLELGEGEVSDGVTALDAYITANPGQVYSWLVPNEWDGDTGYKAMLANYNSDTAKVYFHGNTTQANYAGYSTTLKNVLLTLPAPLAPATEFTAAAQWWNTLSNDPSSTNRLAPLQFRYVFGVTPYPTSGNAALLNTLKAANIGYIDTGAEGGVSTAILKWGKVLTGLPFNFWYSVDWVQINAELALANTVINGSNTQPPLDYNQQGINVLQDSATQTFSDAVTYGLANGNVVQTQLPVAEFYQNYQRGLYRGQMVVNAEPFLVYTGENPDDYSQETYGGLSGVYTSQNGFTSIIFNIGATSFI